MLESADVEEIAPKPALSRGFVHRANSDIAAFLVALDTAYTNLDPRTIDDLRDAADRLLHSCARVRLELDQFAQSIKDKRS